ncbi:hypothetical protein [Chitinilyticum piscinae]|uniref:Uncharacterized protein n=1 Tax=Chitinilyticum piscinae TaxID=2866724 RepID=A0A8J7FUB8_9NEIS|nr:hypothetical protein [Chitinilyticum piscinae]MBE9610731.1 hypothetical protein [Chitinilyticum piscinae]
MNDKKQQQRDALIQDIAQLRAALRHSEQAGNASVWVLLAGDTPLQFQMAARRPVSAKPCDIQLATRFERADADMIAAALPARPDKPVSVVDVRIALRAAVSQLEGRLFALEHGVNVISWQPRGLH